jgi:hypothetical protein
MWFFHGLVNECLFGSISKALCERESGVCVCVIAQSKFCLHLQKFALAEYAICFLAKYSLSYLQS